MIQRSEDKQKQNSANVTENFCGACLAVPLALAGAGTAGIGAKSHKKNKKLLLWSGVGITLISVIIAIIYLKNCKSCR